MIGKRACFCGVVAFLCASLNGMDIQLNKSPRAVTMPQHLRSVAGKKIMSLQYADFICRIASCYDDELAIQLSCYKLAQRLIDYGFRLITPTLNYEANCQSVKNEKGSLLEQPFSFVSDSQLYSFRLFHLANSFKLSERIQDIAKQLVDLRERDNEKFKIYMNRLDDFKEEMKNRQEIIEINFLLNRDIYRPDSPDDVCVSDSEIIEDEQFFSFWLHIDQKGIV